MQCICDVKDNIKSKLSALGLATSIANQKKKSVCDIDERLRMLVQWQEQKQYLAVLGNSEYAIIDEFQHLPVGDNYYRMTPKQKTALKEEFFTCCPTKLPQPSDAMTASDNLVVENHRVSLTRKQPDNNGSI